MFKVTNFDKLLEKATSHLLLEPDWKSIIQICDLIRQGDVPPKVALNNIKKKIQNENPHVASSGLLVLESIVKNCGHLIHDEIATKAFMEQFREIVKTTQHEQVKAKVLELVQAWAFAFRSTPKYHAVQETVTIMKAEGYTFPTLKESDAMFSADTAPKWVDGDVCHRCRATFGVVVRRHHCRACGNVFCGNCSSKTSTIPKFGIEKEVRVCEACYEMFNKPRSASPLTKESESLPAEYLSSSLAQQSQDPKPKKTEEELKEEEDYQLALALSRSEAEAKEKEKKRITSAVVSNASNSKKTTAPVKDEEEDEDEDPELARYLNRSYWEKRQAEEKSNEKKRTSPDHFRSSPGGPPSAPTTPTHHLENGEMKESELNDFVADLKSQVEIFVNRMKSNSSRGRSISNDSSVQTLFMNVTMNHSTLLRYIHQQDDSRVYFEGLQDKLAQVKDAMMALDALREEHREKLRREAEEAERQKQIQMAQKLEIMRRRKQEYLQYQRQLAIQKIQEQEREMQMRQEQQKQQYLMGMSQASHYATWDNKLPSMQPPPHQFGQQFQSLPAGNPPSIGYALQGPGVVSQPPVHMTGVIPPNAIPPGTMPSGPHSLPPQGHVSMPPQQGPSRAINPQPNQGPMPNQPMGQMHSHQVPPNFQGIPPVQNTSLGVNPNMIPQSQSLVMPHNGPVSLPMAPVMQQKVNMPPNPSHPMVLHPGVGPNPNPGGTPMPAVPPGIAAQNQLRLPDGHLRNPPMPSINVPPEDMNQARSETYLGPRNTHQQYHQVQPGGEQSHSSSTGELISFD